MYADWAYHRPGAEALIDAGFTGVIRYLSPTPDKNLSPNEILDYRDANLAVHGVYESVAGRALQGYVAGVTDARSAVRQARSLGWDETSGGCIYFAVDTDIVTASQMHNVYAYFAGVTSILPKRYVGGYGEADVIRGLYAQNLIRYRWQTMAWSRGQQMQCEIYQRGQQTVNGVLVDVNDVMSADTGAWFPVLNEASVRAIVKDEIHTALTEFLTDVWSMRMTDAEPPVRRLVDMQSTLVEAIPDQVGTVGVAVALARAEIGHAIDAMRGEVGQLSELVKTFITAFKPDDV